MELCKKDHRFLKVLTIIKKRICWNLTLLIFISSFPMAIFSIYVNSKSSDGNAGQTFLGIVIVLLMMGILVLNLRGNLKSLRERE